MCDSSSDNFHTCIEQKLSDDISKLSDLVARILKTRAKDGLSRIEMSKYYCQGNLELLFDSTESEEDIVCGNNLQSLFDEIQVICKIPPLGLTPNSPNAEDNEEGSQTQNLENAEDNTSTNFDNI